MPTIDKRFLTKMLIALALVLGALFGLHSFQASRIPAALRRQAERDVAAGKPDHAINHLRQYLEFEPDDVDVLAQLADLLRLRSGTSGELHFLYDRILRGDPGRNAIRREALALALQFGRFSDALSHAEILLKADPKDAAIWQQQAAAQAGLRQFDQARTSYETAVKINPNDALAWQRLAQFQIADLRKPEEAKATIDRMIAALPNDAQSYLSRIRYVLMTEGEKPLPPLKSDPVLADVARALDLAPDNPDLLLVKAERLQRHRDIIGARAALAAGVQKHPGNQSLVRALAWLEVNRNNMAGAIGVLDDALPYAKDGLDLMVPLADLLLDSGDTARAEEILKKLDRRPGPIVKMQAKYLRCRLAMRANQWNDAIALLTSLRTDAVNLPGLEAQSNLLLATCYQKIGEPANAIDALKVICSKDATHVAAHVALGQLYMNDGRFTDAIRVYEIAAQSAFAPPSTFTTLLRMKALQLANAKAKPEAWAALEKQLDGYAPRFGTNAVEPVILRAELATLAGQWQQAVAILKQEANRRPQSTPLWCKLSEAVGNVEGVAAGLAVLDEAQGFVPDGAEMRLARAKLYAKDPAKLRPLDLLCTGIESWSDAEQLQFAFGMIEVYDSVGQKNRELWQRILARRPNDVETCLAYYRAFRDPQSASEVKPMLAKLFFMSGPRIGNSDQSQQYLQISGIPLDKADYCLFMASIRDGLDPLKDIEEAVRLQPNRLDTVSAYLANLANRDEVALKRKLSQLASDPRWAGEPMRRVVQQALQASWACKRPEGTEVEGTSKPVQGVNTPRSQELLLAAVQPFVERQPGGLGWLADQYAAIGNKKMAYDLAKTTAESTSATVEDWLRLYLSKEESIHSTAYGISILSPKNKVVFNASLSATLDEPFKWDLPLPPWHRDFAQASLAIYQARFDRKSAIQFLSDYLEKEIPPADRAWATRNLAMLLVVRGEASDREKAAKLLTDSALTEAGTSLEDRRTSASTLAGLQRYLDGTARETAMTRAIELMENVAKESNSPRDAFALCRLLKNAGRTDDAVAKLRGLLQNDPGNIDYLLAGLDVLVEAKQYEPARGFADRLLQLAGNEYRVIAAVAQYEALRGNSAAALALAEGYLRNADPLAGDVPAKTSRTAELLDDLAHLPNVLKTPACRSFTDAAVAKYESLLPGRAEALIKLAALLASGDRAEEAFNRIEKLSRGIPARIVATAAVTALRIAGGNDKQFTRTRQWLDAAKAEEPHSLPLRLCDAEYLTLNGNFAGAEAIYEAILKESPRNVPALNNLAWLLAAKPEQSTRALELIERAAQESGLTGELLDTRSRIRLAANQPALAVQDAGEALKHDKTALRYFHLALAMNEMKAKDGVEFFKEAKQRGLTDRQVHPADVPLYKQLESEMK